jgi:excinuclease ABC subunit A
METIRIRGARTHNLKNINLDLPRDQLIVITGLSGSGKSSLAFDTLYAEGQRRYVESLSAYARQFLQLMEKPDVDLIEGLSPAISIEQKTTSRNPRSTVGTVTEIHDYMRLLWARVGIPYSPATGLPIESQTVSQMVDKLSALPEGERVYLLAPVVRGRKGEYRREIAEWQKAGFQRLKINGGFPGDRAEACRRDCGGRVGRHRRGADRTPQNDLLGEVRLPSLGLHHLRDRTAPVLFQQSLRGLPHL